MDREKQIEKMMKSVCMNCRYFMRCNDDTMCDGRALSEILRESCFTWKCAESIYDAGYRKQSDVAREIFEEIEKLKLTKFGWQDYVDWNGIAQIKKKYTGDKEDA